MYLLRVDIDGKWRKKVAFSAADFAIDCELGNFVGRARGFFSSNRVFRMVFYIKLGNLL